MIVGIDASRCRSGGSKEDLIGIIENLEPEKHGITKIHLWTYKSLSNEISSYSLVKHTPDMLEKNLCLQLWWQLVMLSKS